MLPRGRSAQLGRELAWQELALVGGACEGRGVVTRPAPCKARGRSRRSMPRSVCPMSRWHRGSATLSLARGHGDRSLARALRFLPPKGSGVCAAGSGATSGGAHEGERARGRFWDVVVMLPLDLPALGLQRLPAENFVIPMESATR
ncbi:unnamed protein product [Lampetra planeri]